LNKSFICLLLVVSFALGQSIAMAATTIELVPSSRVILKLAPGMTLDEIIERIYPKEKDLWPQIREQLMSLNPTAFQPNSDILNSGTRLKLIDIKRVYEQELIPKTKVGYVSRVTGQVASTDVNDRVHQLQVNSRIFEGDRISTEIGASLFVIMDDGAEIYVKEDSVLKVSEYVITNGYDGESSSILDLLRGGLRKITGSIGQSALANYQVQTGLATIGIRGTEYVIKLCKQDDCSQTVSRNDPDAKLHAVVLAGAITLTTDEEVQILMAIGEYGTASNEALTLEEEAPVPVGFLDAEESHKFNVTIPKQLEQASEENEGESNTWKWTLGILLLAVGL
jgi:hypothetical protein